MFEIILPLPPAINRTYRRGRNSFYVAPEAATWKETAYYLLQGEMNRRHQTVMTVPVQVELAYWFKGRRDIDSGIKITLDALEGTVIENDTLVHELAVVVAERGSKNPRVLIRVVEL